MRQFTFFLTVLTCLCGSQAVAVDTTARAAMVIDHDTQTVLLSKNADLALPPASMSKLMTLAMVFEALQTGRLSLTEKFRVSEKAWKMGGSKMFLRAGEEVSIEDLIRGVIVHSGNDACVVLAEGLAGSETAFADRMTRRARELGMANSTFANSTGWPHPDHRMAPSDLVMLATHLINTYPEYYPYFSERNFTWDGIEQSNRNPLLTLDLGADGLKTGHTEEAGFGLVGSATRDGRRMTFMLTGLASARDRLVESERLVNWAFREFYARDLYEADAVVATADVWLGADKTLALIAPETIEIVVPFEDRAKVKAHVAYNGPVEAPIAEGQVLAELVVEIPQLGEKRFPLVAQTAVAAGGFMTRLNASAKILGGKIVSSANDLIN